jgi:hypothetical protein
MNLSQLLNRERASRAMGHSYEAEVFIWREDEADGVAKLEAAKAAGRIGPRTEVFIVGWSPATDMAAA